MPITNQNLLHWLTIGFSGPDPAKRYIGRGLLENGWQWFVKNWMQPAIDRNCGKVLLHDPAGCDAGEAMDFDQFVEMDRKYSLFDDEFVKTIKPITAKGIEVIAYLGSMSGDPDKPTSPGAWLEWVARSVKPALDAGCTIAFDASNGFTASSKEGKVIELVESLCGKVYIEPWATKWGLKKAGIITDELYYNTAPQLGNSWAAPLKESPELIRLVLPVKSEAGVDIKAVYRKRFTEARQYGYSLAGDYNLMRDLLDPGATIKTYKNIVLEAGSALAFYCPMDDVTGTVFKSVVGNDITLGTSTAKPVLGTTPGPISGESGGAPVFDGTNDFATVAIDLSAFNKISIEFWLWWNTNAADDDLAMEFTANYNTNAGSFIFDVNSGTAGGRSDFGLGTSGTRNLIRPLQASAAAWHHYAFVIDRTAAGSSIITPYIDGVSPDFTYPSTSTLTGNFANSTLNLFCRNAASLFGAGRMRELSIRSDLISANTAKYHYLAGINGANRWVA